MALLTAVLLLLLLLLLGKIKLPLIIASIRNNLKGKTKSSHIVFNQDFIRQKVLVLKSLQKVNLSHTVNVLQ